MNTEPELMEYIQKNGSSIDVGEVSQILYLWRRQGNLESALRCGEASLQLVPDNKRLLNCVAWIYYSIFVKPLDDESPIVDCLRIFQNGQRFRLPDNQLLRPTEFDPYKTIAFTISKLVIQRDPRLCLKILATIPVTSLFSVMKTYEGKLQPSELQNYFGRLTKALEQVGSWQLLWDMRDQAISSFEGSDKQHWVVKRVVTAAIELGDLNSAGQYASHRCVPRNDKNWLITFAHISDLSGDRPKAIEFLKSSISQHRDLSFAVNNLATLTQWLSIEDVMIAESLTFLEYQIRQKQGWPIKSGLQMRVDAISRPHSDLLTEKQLQDWWGTSTQKVNQPRQSGVIKSHLSNGFGGFITSEGGEDLYFAVPRGSQDPLLPIGTRVTFVVTEGFDKKKNRSSSQAQKVRKEK